MIPTLRLTKLVLVSLVLGGLAAAAAEPLTPPDKPWFPKAPALPAPTGPVVKVATAEELLKAAAEAKPGDTIMIADGRYALSKRLEIKTDNVTVRGASGKREAVILDADGRGELVAFTGGCSGVTVADLSIQNARWNGFKIDSQTGVQKLTIYNCIIHNVWQRGVKGVIVPLENREKLRPKNFRIQYCLFYNDRPKRKSDDADDIAGGNYIAGIDVMFASDWVVSDNVFVGINGSTGEGRGAIFMWHDIVDCVIERNVFIDCDAGICLGNSAIGNDVKFHGKGCIIRNNFVTRAHENGICLVYTQDCKVLNNTIHDPQSKQGRLIRMIVNNDGLLVANNIVSGPKIRIESDSKLRLVKNLEKDLTASFVDPAGGDLHLKDAPAEVTGQAEPLPEVTDDIDRRPRGNRPDLGACQRSESK